MIVSEPLSPGIEAQSLADYVHPRYWAEARAAYRPAAGFRGTRSRFPAPCDGSIASAADAEVAGALVRGQIDLLAMEHLRLFGWTRLDVAVSADRFRRELVIRGDVALSVIGFRTAYGLAAPFTRNWRLVLDLTTADESRQWRRLKLPLTKLWSECPRNGGTATLATELVPDDGPVQVLAHVDAATLVRAIDGTTGWITDALGPTVGAFRLPKACSPIADWRTSARSYLGVSYELGGTTHAGLDCSGLVQRVYREVVGAVIPRHSGDQVATFRTRHAFAPRRSGDLIFTRCGSTTRRHVGIVLCCGNVTTVVHASSTHGSVVEVPFHEYVQASGEVEHVSMEHALSKYQMLRTLIKPFKGVSRNS